jgi:choline dehydrogenase-like flavoprotein
MIIDAANGDIGSSIDCDLCIVGGGTAGLVLAREFIGQPVQICLLESGGLAPEPATQDLTLGENIGQPYFPLNTARPRVFGGSGTRWDIPIGPDRLGVRIRPLDRIDFEKRDWVPYSGWPFGREHLEPFYRRAQAVCRVEPPTYDVGDWSDSDQRPPLPLTDPDVQTVIYKFSHNQTFVNDYPNEVRQAPNVTVCLHSNVLEIETTGVGDCVSRLRVGTLGGKEFSVRAQTYVLAAGGIEVPRILLLSNQIHKTGLGNENDLVGRFFQEHPHFWSGVFVPNKPEFFQSTALYNTIHAVNGVATIGKLALTDSALRREKLLNQNVQFALTEIVDPAKFPLVSAPGVLALKKLVSAGRNNGDSTESLGRQLVTVFRDLDEIGASAWRKVRSRLFGEPTVAAVYFANMMEQIPDPDSRVTLGSERDAFGQNRVQLNWRISAEDMRSAIRTQEIIGGALEKAGLGRFYQQLREPTPPPNTEGGYHHMGTTRMHVDPKQGVVDANCRIHGVGNMFIAGPSVFPTGGYANPVLTIVALTLRLADHLKAHLRNSLP